MRAPVWIALPILAAGCAGGSVHHAAKQEQRQAPAQRNVLASVPSATTTAAHRRMPKPRRRRVTHGAPPQHPHGVAIPWRRDGVSHVAFVHVKRVAVYRSPLAGHALLALKRYDGNGTQRAFLVRGTSNGWVHVYLPTRPNGSLGWVRRRAVRMYTDGYRLVVRLRAHRLQLWSKRQLLATYPVAVGTPSTPTPRGLYYIVELLRPTDPGGSYGPYSFGLSAHSNVLQTFAGGDGRVGLHGTNEPGLIGSSVSHGCIRLRNADVRRLAKILPLGTPVYIRM